ncbi:anti-sigma factor [candidate division KSB1 bacterium]|nr:anti-sigma factor [candidate division KSB1 bacterium]
MKCQEIQNKLELYLDNELSAQAKAEIEAHLSTCATCAKQLADLTSLTSLGKQEIFSEPSPLYWKELRLNIMNEIKAADKKSIDLAALLHKLKNFIVAPNLSYRLAGLAATAVIVFFIIHFSFIRQGKFELPQQIEIQDSISISEQKAESIETKKEETPEAPSLAKAPVPQAIPKATSFQDKGSGKLSTLQNEPQAIVNIPDREAEDLHEPSKIIEPELNVGVERVDSQQNQKKSIPDETAPPKREVRRVMAKPAYMSFEKSESFEKDADRIQAGGVDKSSTFADTSLSKFEITIHKVQEVSELTNKIKIWEEFVQTQPELDLLNKAKYEQARLYFDRAQKKKTEDYINLAIKFYENNFEYLAAVADSSQIESELEALRQLLKKK